MRRRSKEERIATIDELIAKKQSEIVALEAKRQQLLHPVSMRKVLTKAKESGLTPEEIAEKLGLAFE